jgi:NAD(P)-dependent dehydrogenase (short-subunit alcohol dehydrogenase family)
MSKQTIIVTGGSRGIGLGIAKELAAHDCNVVINGRRPQADVQEVIDSLDTDVLYVAADVGSVEDRQNLVQKTVERFGRIDGLVNNAGVAPDVRADLLDAGEASFERLMRINLQGPYFLTQAVARQMQKQHEADADWRGSVVFVTSVSATVASINRGDYCISKAGLAMATKLWAARLGDLGVGVYEVRPGVIQTDMTSGVAGKYDQLFEEGLAIERRWGLPEDVARAVGPLARGELTYATGSVLHVDGGLTLPRL